MEREIKTRDDLTLKTVLVCRSTSIKYKILDVGNIYHISKPNKFEDCVAIHYTFEQLQELFKIHDEKPDLKKPDDGINPFKDGEK